MNNTDIKVSVIMPIYNASAYLRPAMDSVLTQTLKEIEIICVEDGSTDSSYELIKEYQKQDSRIRIVTETNAGPAHARNNGLKRARGEYISFLDADDFFEPTLLETLYNTAKERDLDIAIAEYDIYNTKKATFEKAPAAEHEEIFRENEVTSKNEYSDQIFLAVNGAAWNKLFRRALIEEKGLAFLPDVKMYEDVYFVVTAMSLAERVGKVFETLVHHRIYKNQARAKMFKKHYMQVPFVYSKIKEFLMHTGMYLPLSASYLNLTASRCYKIYNLLGSGAQEDFWNALHNEYAEKLGWHDKTAEDFENCESCDFVANVILYNHKHYKKHVSRTRHLSWTKVKARFKKIEARKNFRAFLSVFAFWKLFKRKKAEK